MCWPCGVGKAVLGGKIWRGGDVPDRIQEKGQVVGCYLHSRSVSCVTLWIMGRLGGVWAGEWPDMTYILTTSFWLFTKAGAEAGDPFGDWCNNMGGSEYSSRYGGEWQDSEHILKRKQTNSWWMWYRGRKGRVQEDARSSLGHGQESIVCLTWRGWGEQVEEAVSGVEH